jgi:hypothetical protein
MMIAEQFPEMIPGRHGQRVVANTFCEAASDPYISTLLGKERGILQ